MRLLLTAAVYAALTVSAAAQPKEVTVSETLRFAPGEVRVFTFDQPVGKIAAPGDIVQIDADSDRTFTFRAGAKVGSTILTIYDSEGRAIYRSNLVVTGTVVKIYGGEKDYTSYLCTDIGCGRSDPDVERKGVTSESIAVTRRNNRGEIITTTKNY